MNAAAVKYNSNAHRQVQQYRRPTAVQGNVSGVISLISCSAKTCLEKSTLSHYRVEL